MKDLDRFGDDLLRLERTGRLDREQQLVVVFANVNALVDAVLSAILDALLAEAALVSFLDLDRFSLLIELEDLTRAHADKITTLKLAQLGVQQFFVAQLHNRLLAHDACCDGRPLGVNLASALLGDELEVKDLVLGKFRQQDGWLLDGLFGILEVNYRCQRLFVHELMLTIDLNVFRRDLHLLISAGSMQPELDRAFVAHARTSTVLMESELVNVMSAVRI